MSTPLTPSINVPTVYELRGQLDAKPDKTPDRGDLELALHAAHGLFKTLNWINSEQIAVDEVELRNVRHDLVVAGQLMTKDILNRV